MRRAVCDMCFHKIAGLKPDFAVMGGDHVFDALSVDRARATAVFDLYKKTESAYRCRCTTRSEITTCLA
jgi:3',5'-cyclic-AMP phosphodiesterase